MEKLLQAKDEEYVKDLFQKNLVNEVKLTLIVQSQGGDKVNKFNEPYLPYAEEIIQEIASLSDKIMVNIYNCLLYTSPSPRDRTRSRMPSSA